MKHTEIIQKIIDRNNAKIYLEIGAASGKNFLSIKAREKFAVDPKNKILLIQWLKNFSNFFHSKFYEMKSDNFFSKHGNIFQNNKIDVAFVDGMHTYEQSLSDVKNCLKHLNNDGVIIIHDCNPTSKELASITPNKGTWNGDVWKTIVWLRTQRDLNVFVLDTDWGVGIVTRAIPENTISLTENEIGKLTYEDLEKNRREYLNLKPENYLFTFLLK